MTQNGRGYEILDLAYRFHEFRHLNYKLQVLKNSTFDPTSQDYLTSLAVFAGIPIVVLIIILVIYLLMTCISCCCCSNKKRETIPIQYKVVVFLFGLICGLSFISGLYGDWKLYDAVKGVRDSTDDAVKWFDEVGDNTKELTRALDVSATIVSLENSIDLIADKTGVEAIRTYKTNCQTIRSNVASSRAQVSAASESIDKANVDFIPKALDTYGRIFIIVVLAILLSLAIVGLLYVFSICCSRCLLSCLTVLAVIALILCSLLVSASLVSAVGVSDFCIDAKPWIRSQMNNELVNDYLIECVGENKVDKDLAKARLQLDKAEQEMSQLSTQLNTAVQTACKTGGPVDCGTTPADLDRDLKKLDNQIGIIKQLMTNFDQLAKCERLNGDLNGALNSVCTDAVKGVAFILINTVVAAFCFALLSFVGTCALN
ncbi:protein tweety homolog 2-like [Oppia nitens]|uniref:protein tweety homolog 2-like n=1 Tax=Oppia nitens TaxID=1686743 RepID=UPI0023DBF7E6|nr:protein tweety homolog 2-like [Oppia nitens]